jgi:hypothetical protein
MSTKNEINKLVLLRENDWDTSCSIEYREYEWDNETHKPIFHDRIQSSVLKTDLPLMLKTMIFTIGTKEFNLNKDKTISFMSLGEVNKEEAEHKRLQDEKSARLEDLQQKINKRMKDKKR